MTTKQIGDLAEDLSVKILTDNKFDIICKNYRTRLGEIDIICFKRFHLLKLKVYVCLKTMLFQNQKNKLRKGNATN